jgi:hypothetical protein
MNFKLISITVFVFNIITFKLCAQNDVAFFQIEDNNYLQFENYEPTTKLECYSTKHGGKLIKTTTLIKNELTTEVFNVNNTPDFVLNRLTASNPKGTDKTQFMDSKEFIAQKINLEIVGGAVNITWDAITSIGANIEYQIMKNTNNQPYSLVKSFHGIEGEASINYRFNDAYTSSANYILVIQKGGKKIRYKSNPIKDNTPVFDVNVYPTVCNNNLFVDVKTLENTVNYIIADINGKILMEGLLSNLYNQLDIQRLSKGNYIVKITQDYNTKSFKIIKN